MSEIETLIADANAVENPAVGIDQSAGDFTYDMKYEFDAGTGLSEKTVRYISSVKKEAPWILEFRLAALKKFLSMPMPTHWATTDLNNIDFDKIRYYLSQGQKPKRTWDEVPDDIKKTFERLGIPEQERKFLAGVEAQFDSEAAYSNIKDIVAKQGVIFCNSTEALREHPEIFKKFFRDFFLKNIFCLLPSY
jgi:Fe-S cluster assembly protein SufB